MQATPLEQFHDYWFPPVEGAERDYPWNAVKPSVSNSLLATRGKERHEDYHIAEVRSRTFRVCLIVGLVLVFVLTILLVAFVAVPFVSLSRKYKEELEQSHWRIQKLREQLKKQPQQIPPLNEEQKSDIIQQGFATVAAETMKERQPSFMQRHCPDKAVYVKEWWTNRLKTLFHSSPSSLPSPSVETLPITEPQQQQNVGLVPNLNSNPSQGAASTPPDPLKHLVSKDLLGLLVYHAPRPDIAELNDRLAQKFFQDYVALLAHLRHALQTGGKNAKLQTSLLQLTEAAHGRKVIEGYLTRKKCGWFRRLSILNWMHGQKQKFDV